MFHVKHRRIGTHSRGRSSGQVRRSSPTHSRAWGVSARDASASRPSRPLPPRGRRCDSATRSPRRTRTATVPSGAHHSRPVGSPSEVPGSEPGGLLVHPGQARGFHTQGQSAHHRPLVLHCRLVRTPPSVWFHGPASSHHQPAHCGATPHRPTAGQQCGIRPTTTASRGPQPRDTTTNQLPAGATPHRPTAGQQCGIRPTTTASVVPQPRATTTNQLTAAPGRTAEPLAQHYGPSKPIAPLAPPRGSRGTGAQLRGQRRQWSAACAWPLLAAPVEEGWDWLEWARAHPRARPGLCSIVDVSRETSAALLRDHILAEWPRSEHGTCGHLLRPGLLPAHRYRTTHSADLRRCRSAGRGPRRAGTRSTGPWVPLAPNVAGLLRAHSRILGRRHEGRWFQVGRWFHVKHRHTGCCALQR